MAEKKLTKRDFAVLAAVFLGPFASSFWMNRYWRAIHAHLVWLIDGHPDWDGPKVIACLFVLGAHVGAFVYVAVRKGWFPNA